MSFHRVICLDQADSVHRWSSKPLLYGNILHELLQETLQTREFSAQSIKACLDAILRKPSFQLDIWSCDLGIEEVRAEVWEKAMQSLVTFGDKWVGSDPKVCLFDRSLVSLTHVLIRNPLRYMIRWPNWRSRVSMISKSPYGPRNGE